MTSGVRNCYSFFQYGGRAKRSSIMVLEGDAALKCGEDMAYLWRGLLVDFGVDNSSFKGSIAKGYSKSPQVAMICRRGFFLQVQHSFLVRWFWLSSEANSLADHLSRGRRGESWNSRKRSRARDFGAQVPLRTRTLCVIRKRATVARWRRWRNRQSWMSPRHLLTT